jgi:hypothetical protein
MKNELLHITNVEILNKGENTITYSEYDKEQNKVIETTVPITYENVLIDWDIVYNDIINKIDNLGEISKINSDFIDNVIQLDKNDIYTTFQIFSYIEDIIKYISSNTHDINGKVSDIFFVILNEELHGLIKEQLDNMINVNYHINNNIGNKVLVGIKNDFDETGINVYFNRQKSYSIITQGKNINNYFSFTYNVV